MNLDEPSRFSRVLCSARTEPKRVVDVWQLDLDTAPLMPSILDERELLRMGRFLQPKLQYRYGAAHTGLRRILSPYIGVHPGSIRFGQEVCCGCGLRHGKPKIEFPETDVEFSLSHSQHIGAVAVTEGMRIGVDVEVDNFTLDHLRIAQKYFAVDEFEELRSASARDRARFFTMAWTRKEAVLKAVGTGIGPALSALSLDQLPSGVWRGWHSVHGRRRVYQVHEMAVDGDASCALAVEEEWKG